MFNTSVTCRVWLCMLWLFFFVLLSSSSDWPLLRHKPSGKGTEQVRWGPCVYAVAVLCFLCLKSYKREQEI